ncbi:MAG TPA: iron ABC transporter permease [Polyangiaceae bacterium]
MRGRVALLVACCVSLLLLAVFVGQRPEGERGAFILWQLRVPRVLVGALVGATLALVGAVFQALFQNPLATSDTVGTTAGATLGALTALAFDASRTVSGLPWVTLCAFAGALCTSSIVAGLAASRRVHSSDVLLSGIAVTLATSALATGVQYLSDARALFAATQWALGQLPQVGYRGALLLLPISLVSCGALLVLRRQLQAFALGEELAHSQGVDVARLRLLALGFGSLGVAGCVAWCGPIAFVGLIVPHAVRLSLGGSYRTLLPMSALAGAAFLVGSDLFARLIMPGRELPVGIVTAALGAPTLTLLVARKRGR